VAEPAQGAFFFWGDRGLYLGWDLPATVHAHHAVQVCIGLSGPVRLRTDPCSTWEDYDAAVVPSDRPHVSEYVPGTAIATLWFEPESSTARRIGVRSEGAAILASRARASRRSYPGSRFRRTATLAGPLAGMIPFSP
jgi:hypothetical protein